MVVVTAKDFDAAREHLKEISEGADKVISMAINKGLRSTYTQVHRKIRQFYAIKQKNIKEALGGDAFKWATPKNPRGSAKFESARLPAIYFDPRPRPTGWEPGKAIKIRKGRLISVQIRRGTRVDMVHGSYYNPGKKLTIMRRASGDAPRYPVKPVTSLSVPMMLAERKIMPQVSQEVRQIVMAELVKQVNRLLTPKAKRKTNP